MLSNWETDSVYLACGATDMRKSIDGLAAIVQLGFALDPFSSSWFVFCNRGRDKLKILRWDHNGFWLYYRRLERGRFAWPAAAADEPVPRMQSSPVAPRRGALGPTVQGVPGTRLVSRRQLMWLLDGLTLEQRKAHPEVDARAAA